jgi:phosphate/sulfate permease
MGNMEDMEDLERLREKEFAERVERIQNIMSRFRKFGYILMVIAAVFMFFHARNDYNNYAGSQLVMAEVINVEDTDNKNINVAYRYNIAGKEYESDKMQYTEKIRKGDKKEIRVNKNNPEIILKHNDINLVIFYDVMIGLCLGLTVLCLYEMATCTLPSAVEEVKAKNVGFTTKPGVTFASIMEENKKKNEKINTEKKI